MEGKVVPPCFLSDCSPTSSLPVVPSWPHTQKVLISWVMLWLVYHCTTFLRKLKDFPFLFSVRLSAAFCSLSSPGRMGSRAVRIRSYQGSGNHAGAILEWFGSNPWSLRLRPPHPTRTITRTTQIALTMDLELPIQTSTTLRIFVG